MRPVDVRTPIRRSLLRLGRRLTARQLANLRSVLGYLELGAWLAGPPARHPVVRYQDVDVFEEALRRVQGQQPLYLEFGVYEGRSMRWWSTHLRQPGASLVGFDSFEGLPEPWRPGLGPGHFATAGPPQIDDPRVSFVAGWFAQTLPRFALPHHDQLIVNIDCDLYSSTATVLDWLEPHVRPGTLIYFDELPDHDHELRALFEWLGRSRHRVDPVAYGLGGRCWVFVCE